jgi:hypothetical protein
LDLAAKYSINRLIDGRNCFELIQREFIIPSRGNNHEHVRTVEQIISGDKGAMIISFTYRIVNESRETIQVVDRNPDNLLMKWIPDTLTPKECIKLLC